MELSKVVQLDKNLWAVNEMDKTLMYFINGGSKVLLIDTGFGLTDLKAVIRKTCGEKPIIVVNTHAHIDHNSGNYQFAEVYVGRYDEPFSHKMIDEDERRLSVEMFFQKAVLCGYDLSEWKPGRCACVRTLEDGDEIDLGEYCLRVIEIPGHTIGSIALLEEKQGWLFTGDTILTWEAWGHLSLRACTNPAPSATLHTYFKSIERLYSMRDAINTVYPAHGTPENIEGYTQYTMPAEILSIYYEGIKDIVEKGDIGENYHHLVEDGKVKMFTVGGIVYDADRMDV